MREILFRGKREDCKRWIYGYYRKSESFDRSFIRVSQVFEHLVIPETVGQYTGLTDKNGKKIFEGDIVEYDGMRATVVWDEFTARFVTEFPDALRDFDNYLFDTDAEVIGNIHDNPELLRLDEVKGISSVD